MCEVFQDLRGVSPFELGEPNEAFASVFDGKSWRAILNSEEVGISNITFEPACRNHWHVHHGKGQILIGVGGRGIYQERGCAARSIEAGSVIYIAPGVEHWHGAVADEPCAHLSLTVVEGDGRNEWLEPVSVEEYAQANAEVSRAATDADA